MKIPNPLRIAVMTDSQAYMDIVYTYMIDTKYGEITVMLYDNMIPLNVHAVLSEYQIDVPENVHVIIDNPINVLSSLEDIVEHLVS